ncbi:4Fe-4S ferredoxin [archaeon]|nr:4Fe-4S ferredoxin [archaeon]
MNDRFLKLQELFDNQKYFKMICGAGNEDLEEVKRLTMIYTLAGAKGLDISATPSVVESCVEGIDRAFDISDSLGINLKTIPYIMVSVGMPGDHHVRKAFIDPDTCIKCGLCVSPVCPTEAIKPIEVGKEIAFVIEEKCIGCGDCSAICPILDIISYTHNEKALSEILPKCIELGAENIELHAAIAEDKYIMKEWEIVNKSNPNGHNSMCLDRLHLGNFGLEHRIKFAKELAGDRLIIQADGYPMSGGEDNYNTTLQAVATADVINKAFNMRLNKKTKRIEYKKYREVNILVSGGTNSLTSKLANQSDVRFQGVSIGTFARNLIYKNIKEKYDYEDNVFYTDMENIKEAYRIAKTLVEANVGEVNE